MLWLNYPPHEKKYFMKKNLALNALLRCNPRRLIRRELNPTLRRNLLFFSVLSIFAAFVDFKGSSVNLNLGLISGTIKTTYLYWGLILILSYQMSHFWAENRSAWIFDKNYKNITASFVHRLAADIATEKFGDITSGFKGINGSIGGFQSIGAIGSDCLTAFLSTDDRKIDDIPGLKETIERTPNFSLSHEHDTYKIQYEYHVPAKDVAYLHMHRDYFWMATNVEILENVVPLAVGITALWALLYKAINHSKFDYSLILDQVTKITG